MTPIEQAMKFATEEHVTKRGQLYAHLLPYTHHLEDVYDVLLKYGFGHDENLLAASWLHDIVEDTRDTPNKVTTRNIEELFGDDVAELVGAVTSEEGPNRKTRNALTYPKIRAAGPRAVVLKLADRIANVSFGGRARDMYKKEHADFRHGIYLHKGDASKWAGHHATALVMQDDLDALLG